MLGPRFFDDSMYWEQKLLCWYVYSFGIIPIIFFLYFKKRVTKHLSIDVFLWCIVSFITNFVPVLIINDGMAMHVHWLSAVLYSVSVPSNYKLEVCRRVDKSATQRPPSWSTETDRGSVSCCCLTWQCVCSFELHTFYPVLAPITWTKQMPSLFYI